MTPVEKMARAIIQSRSGNRDFRLNPICAEEMTVAVPMARAALEALREPSFGMKMAGAEGITLETMRANANYDGACDCWSAMITAALNEGE